MNRSRGVGVFDMENLSPRLGYRGRYPTEIRLNSQDANEHANNPNPCSWGHRDTRRNLDGYVLLARNVANASRVVR